MSATTLRSSRSRKVEEEEQEEEQEVVVEIYKNFIGLRRG